jgi:hypothetical protein
MAQARENIKISHKESVGYYEFKKHKPWMDKRCVELLDQRKQAKFYWLQDPSEINGDNLNNKPSLWSRGQSFWLQIQRPSFDSRCYQIFWEEVGLEWGPLSLVSTTKELLRRQNSGSGIETRNTAVGIHHADHATQTILKIWH